MSNEKLAIPELSLVLLVGPSGSGKSTFARRHFKPTEILSSDGARALICDDENDQICTQEAFELLHTIAGKRLKRGKLTLIDATNVQPESRRSLIELARHYHVLPVAIVLNLSPQICLERNRGRSNRNFGKEVIRRQHHQLQCSLRSLKRREGVTRVHLLRTVEQIEEVEIIRERTWTNKVEEKAPFDIVGDIHGCFAELEELLQKLGYQIERGERYTITHPEGRRLIFLGDLVDRGPNSPKVLRLVIDAVASGIAFCVNGNHDEKLKKKLMGGEVTIAHGLQQTLDQLAAESEEFGREVLHFLQGLRSHYLLDGGKLAVAHAGVKEEHLGRGSPAIREFCLFGETTGEIDKFGLPVRYDWAREYRGETLVIYGHTPILQPEWINNTLNIDTGCVFGGKLTALRYPERELVSVQAAQVYCQDDLFESKTQQPPQEEEILQIEDVLGKQIISTQLHHDVTIREEYSAAALEIMGRFALDPRWLIYLPPTISPTETHRENHFLEHPKEGFTFYKRKGIKRVICEEKHMGSRVVIIICKNADAAWNHFHIAGEAVGCCYTRTGRNFFTDAQIEHAFLARVKNAIERSGLWETLNTDWICLDAELMPWSAKSLPLLKEQYAPIAVAGRIYLTEAERVLHLAMERKVEPMEECQQLHDQFSGRLEKICAYQATYRRYCWPVQSIEEYRLAPFHILADANTLHMDKNHLWHLEQIDLLCASDPQLFCKTERKIVELEEQESWQEAIDWWLSLTAKGGEGMVIKPLDFTVMNREGLVQPAIKCRGTEYLRIIYGAEYDDEQNLERLRNRNLKHKRSLALREYALGHLALQSFVQKAPFHKVHRAVFGILALESEPVDPRL